MPDLISVVTGSVAVAVGVLTGAGQYRRLSTRPASRLQQVLKAPAGKYVRLGLVVAAAGATQLTSGWASVAPMAFVFAVVAWEIAVRVTARRASRAA
jgi:hypothetical protein